MQYIAVCLPSQHRIPAALLMKMTAVDYYAALAWWHQDYKWSKWYDLQFAGITLSWLTGLNIGWDCLNYNGLWAYVTSGSVHHFQMPLTVPLHSAKDRQMSAAIAEQRDCEKVYVCWAALDSCFMSS